MGVASASPLSPAFAAEPERPARPSQSTPPASFHPEATIDGVSTRVMCEMVGAVDMRALGDHVAHLAHHEQRAVDDALELVLDLG